MRDRGKVGFSCTEQMLIGEWGSLNVERGANEYAADLLMPEEMFMKEARNENRARLPNLQQTRRKTRKH